MKEDNHSIIFLEALKKNKAAFKNLQNCLKKVPDQYKEAQFKIPKTEMEKIVINRLWSNGKK